jgi:putative transposase
MARRPRVDLPGIPQHVVQRGNDRQPCFFADADRHGYLQNLREIAPRERCQVHAYVLMTNDVHLLITPEESGQVARLMQALGRRYVRYVNDRYRRTGTLWEGRYKSSLVDRDTYLLRCYRYIELNPVRARMCADPADYPWSSHRANALGHDDPLIHPHPNYQALGATREARCAAYRDIAMETLSDEDIEAIRLHLQRQHALGSDRFRTAIEAQLARPVGPLKIGRPRKAQNRSEIRT